MNVNLQTCDSCFKSETLSCWSTKIHMLCFLGFYRTPTDSTKEKDKRRGRRKRGKNRIVPELFSFSGEVKSTSKELRLKCDLRDLPSLVLVRVSWCDRGSLPPTKHSQTQACCHAVHDFGHNKYGSKVLPKGSEWRTQAAGGRSWTRSHANTNKLTLPLNGFIIGELTQERANLKSNGGCFRCPSISPTDLLTPASAGWGLFPCKVDDTTGGKKC